MTGRGVIIIVRTLRQNKGTKQGYVGVIFFLGFVFVTWSFRSRVEKVEERIRMS